MSHVHGYIWRDCPFGGQNRRPIYFFDENLRACPNSGFIITIEISDISGLEK